MCKPPVTEKLEITQPIHRTATARLAVDTTFTMETSISRNLWGT